MRVSQSPKTPLQSAIQRLSQGQYYAGRTAQVLVKADRALDGFVGAAMNISQDNEQRDVSRQGEQLLGRLRKSERYLSRGEVNQSAHNSALTEARDWLKTAVDQATTQTDKTELSQALGLLEQMTKDNQTETGIGALQNSFDNEAKPRLDDVVKDAVGRNVSQHGRPVWDLFENTKVSLNTIGQQALTERDSLGSLIADLQRVNAREG